MADVVQWGIDEFYAQLQNLENIAAGLKNRANANRLDLMHLWDATKTQPEPTRTKNQQLLNPLIHQNSVLRTQYLAPITAKFNEAVNAASAVIRQAGYQAPATLSGLGIAPVLIIVPTVAITAVVVALAWASVASKQLDVQNKNTQNVAAIINDHTLTPAQRTAELAALTSNQQAAAAAAKAAGAPPPGFDLTQLTPILIGIAAILVLPSLLPLIHPREGR